MPRTDLEFTMACSLLVCLLSLPAVGVANVSPAWQEAVLTISLAPASQSLEPARSFAVQVMVDGAANLGAFEFDLTYDPAVVTVTGVELGPFLGSSGRSTQFLGPEIDHARGTVAFGAFSFGDSPGPEGRGVLATVTLMAASSGSSALQLQNVLVTDTGGSSQAVSVQGGTVAVAELAATSAPTMTARPTSPPIATATRTAGPTATRTAAATARFTSTGTATATATPQAAATPTTSPRATETPSRSVTTGGMPAASETPPPTTTEMPVPVTTNTVTGVPAITGPSATPSPAPPARATSTRSRTATPPPSWTPSLALPTLVAAPTTVAAVERPLIAVPSPSPVTVAFPVAVLSDPMCWLPVGGAALVLLGRLLHFLLYRHKS